MGRPGAATIKDVGRLEVLWLRILGVLLILLGLTLVLAPRVAYTTHERIGHTAYRVRRDKAILVPRPVAVLIAAGGLLILALARKPK
jgi:hypothetical protein